MVAIAAVVGIIALVVVYAALGLKIVKQFEQGLVERFGKYRNTRDPGLHLIVPFIDRMRRVDMREIVVDVPSQEVITKDNVVVTVDAVVYYQAIDPVKLEYNVQNFVLAATKLVQTNLLALMREVKADVVLDSRKIIGAQLREVLDEATDVWGTKVVRVELGQIEFGQAATHVSRSEGDVAREGSGIVTMARD